MNEGLKFKNKEIGDIQGLSKGTMTWRELERNNKMVTWLNVFPNPLNNTTLYSEDFRYSLQLHFLIKP